MIRSEGDRGELFTVDAEMILDGEAAPFPLEPGDVVRGQYAGYREAEGAAYMQRQELVIGVDLGLGGGKATVWTCDLTHRYIEINADYRS